MSSQDHCKIMSRPMIIMVTTTTLVILLGLVSFSSGVPFLNLHRHCKFRYHMPTGFDCKMQCTFLRDHQRICSFNLTEACQEETCLHLNDSSRFTLMNSSSVLHQFPPKMNLNLMFKMLDVKTYHYQACWLPKAYHVIRNPVHDHKYCVPCTGVITPETEQIMKVTCTGLQRFDFTEKFQALALETISEFVPGLNFTTGMEIYFLPMDETPRPDNLLYDVVMNKDNEVQFKLILN